MGSYNQGVMKRLGHSNGMIKILGIRRLGQNHGSSSCKTPMMEMYPKY